MANIAGIAESALTAYTVKQTVTASNLANINNRDYKASSVDMKENKTGGVTGEIVQGQDSVDISKEAVDMIGTTKGFKANLKVLQTQDEMSKELLNIKA